MNNTTRKALVAAFVAALAVGATQQAAVLLSAQTVGVPAEQAQPELQTAVFDAALVLRRLGKNQEQTQALVVDHAHVDPVTVKASVDAAWLGKDRPARGRPVDVDVLTLNNSQAEAKQILAEAFCAPLSIIGRDNPVYKDCLLSQADVELSSICYGSEVTNYRAKMVVTTAQYESLLDLSDGVLQLTGVDSKLESEAKQPCVGQQP